jgi:hypothetical protein
MEELLIKIKNDNDKSEWITLLNEQDIYFNYEKNTCGEFTRLILKIKKNTKKHNLTYYYCNGRVIDTINWKYIAIPPIAFNKSYKIVKINRFLSNYDIIKVIDGTIVTFYYFNNKWNISTSNGYDVSSFYWIGLKTYTQIINDLMQNYKNAVENTGFNMIDNETLEFTKLDKNKSYTVGIRHHDFHPLKVDPEIMWNVQHVDLSTGEINYNDGLLGIPNQKILKFDISSVQEILELNKISIYTDYNYGYILRSKNLDITKKYSSILLNTQLLKNIKQYIYEYPSQFIKQYITNSNRLEFIILKNYFSHNKEILELFPQFHEKYNLYEKIINETINYIIKLNTEINNNDHAIHSNNDHAIHSSNDHAIHSSNDHAIHSNNDDNVKTPIKILGHSLNKHISKIDIINYKNINCKSIIKDYIMNPEYSVLFLYALNKYK